MDLQYVLSGTRLMREVNSRVYDNAEAVARANHSPAKHPCYSTAESVIDGPTKTFTLQIQDIEKETVWDYIQLCKNQKRRKMCFVVW